uniref:Secreted protein n=1 Tax=Caenorhabditis tropicalis TaxID=1561998 RepID=A0A1I7V2R9_9PELO
MTWPHDTPIRAMQLISLISFCLLAAYAYSQCCSGQPLGGIARNENAAATFYFQLASTRSAQIQPCAITTGVAQGAMIRARTAGSIPPTVTTRIILVA